MNKICIVFVLNLIFLAQAYSVTLFKLAPRCLIEYRKACLTAHNKNRLLHNTPNLVFNRTLTDSAERYARKLALNNYFNHSDTKHGENLALIWSSAAPNLKICSIYGNQFTKMWYDEIKFYSFTNPKFSQQTGHFTQVIWKSTTDLGCGLAINVENKAYGVCHYSTRGNIIDFGFFQANVLPLKKSQLNAV